jgi:acyl-[acyl-carrier-protein] desaturase
MYQIGSRLEVLRHVEPFIADNLNVLLREPEKSWQPADFTPDLSTDEGFEELRALRTEIEAMPDDAMVILVGDMITEEALPTYASWIFPLEGVGVQGEPQTAWGAWNRGWCAEENRHGDLLNRYLYLTGRVNMKEVELTIHHLINDGGDTQTENDPYKTFVYTSFQEIATRISHLNVGKIARSVGAERLYKLSSKIAGDENRHARAYKLFISKFMEVDPSETVIAFSEMMKRKIVMPAMYMRERGREMGDTFKKFEVVAGRTGVYTTRDYIDIIENLVKDWDIEHVTGLTPAAAKAQDYLCGLPDRYRKVLDRFKKPDDVVEDFTFSWLNQREIKGTCLSMG